MRGRITHDKAAVNGFLTECNLDERRYIYRAMDLPAILRRIEHRLEVLGLSASAASLAAGKPDAIRNIRRAVASGTRKGVSTVTIAALAPALKTSPQWLLSGEGLPMQVPLVGYVGAGAETVLLDLGQGPFDEVKAPDWATPSTVAVKIRGTSLGFLIDGWIAFYDDRRDPPGQELSGKLCICGLADGRILAKAIRPGSAPGLWHLESQTEPTLFDQKVEWAAEILEMRPG